MRSTTILLFFIFVFALSVQAQDNGPKMTSKEMKQLIDSISYSLNKYYIYPDKALLIEKTLRANLKKGSYNALKDRQEVANTLNEDIHKTHHDGHMRLMYAPDFEKELLTVLPDSLQKKQLETELQETQRNNFYFIKTDIMPGNIGYLRWDAFVGFTQEAKPTYESAFRFVSNAEALIIDMRYNGGGSPETVNALLNYFFDKRLPMNHIIGYQHDTIKNYTNPSLTSFKLNMPVYILTHRRTFSGAEDFTYAMKVAKRATLVGDTTGGGAHPTGPCTLGQGFVINTPLARSWHELTKTNWEGTGVYPDIQIKAEYALEKARLLIFKDFLDKAGDDQEKQNIQGQITAAENKLTLAQNGGMNFTNEELQKFCGEYKALPGPGASPYILTILRKGNSLFRNIQVPPDWKLIPISSTRFVYDNDETNRYMEFTLNKEGIPTGLTIYYPDRKFPYEKIK